MVRSAVVPEIVLRPAEASDALCLCALATQVFLETYATSGIRPALAREVQSKFSIAALMERLSDRAVRITVAEREAHLVAFSELVLGANHSLVGASSAAELTTLYVQSPFVRQGIGKRLLRGAEVLAASQAASTLWLTVWVGNERALAFYASQDYEELGSTQYEFEGEVFENRLFAKSLRAEI
jgi:ribosomal protein S18 acetylase RimI-like enzyme